MYCAGPMRNGPIRFCVHLSTSIRRSTSPCRAPVSWARVASWPSGIAGLTYHGFRVPLSPLVPPTLTIGAAHDTMNSQQMAAMAKALPRGSHLHCPNGSHMAMVDDQVVYIQGLIDFLRRVDAQTIRQEP